MKEWTANEWANDFTNPPAPGSSSKILVADVHRGQQTVNAKKLLQNKSTLLTNVPPGCTSRVQPLDVSIKKPFKHATREQFEKHLRNLDFYTENKLLSQKEECLLQNGLRKVRKKYRETKKL